MINLYYNIYIYIYNIINYIILREKRIKKFSGRKLIYLLLAKKIKIQFANKIISCNFSEVLQFPKKLKNSKTIQFRAASVHHHF
ncbi:hypothetical protein PFNF135_04272 [Plasmodium falciparum NF135/5.C10]|uniref:Uncharacterized protein n=1 Tax=Plasmodium falciparum NF135/5.C10 TaxID=1036726 RepID=W4ID15_PLAFA|nr:hypothetical protein PFNF135_04272 [Plasmodium falciparum NF135/5.C10]